MSTSSSIFWGDDSLLLQPNISAAFAVITANNGKEGIDAARKHTPDLIISDIMMPVLDGFSMLHMLHGDPMTEAIPLIFLTAKTERNDIRKAMESGADDFITKPFSMDELYKAIENRFRKLETLKKNWHPDLQSLNELVSSVNKDSLETLSKDRDVNIFQKKQVIYKEGHMPHYLYFVQKGKVRTYKTHEDGKQLVMDLYNEGDFMGYITLLEETAYKETAMAMEETELALIPKKEFEDLLHKNPVVQQKLIKMLAKNITENENHLLGIAYNTLRKKVAEALTSLQNKFQTKNEPYCIDMSRVDLASIAGTATESFVRILSEFKNEKLIDIKKDNKIQIINAPKLAKLLR